MKGSGFGVKGSSRSSVESTGKRTYAQFFGSPESALRSLIPYSPYNLIYSTLIPYTIQTEVSGATTLVHKWVDLNGYLNLSQSSNAAKPSLDTTNLLGGKTGIRAITDDFLVTPAPTSSDATKFSTIISYNRSNINYTTGSGFYFFTPYSTTLFTPFNGINSVFGLNAWWYITGSNNNSNTINFREYFSAGTQINGASSVAFGQSVYGKNMFLRADIFVQQGEHDPVNRRITTFIKDANATLYASASAGTSSLASPNNTTASWDTGFTADGGMRARYWNLFRGSNLLGPPYVTSDSVCYTFIKINSDARLTDDQITSITKYLKSAYGER